MENSQEVIQLLLKHPGNRTNDDIRKLVRSFQKVRFFADLEDDVKHQVCKVLQLERHPPKSLVIRQGEPAACMYIIISGKISVHVRLDSLDDENTNNKVLADQVDSPKEAGGMMDHLWNGASPTGSSPLFGRGSYRSNACTESPMPQSESGGSAGGEKRGSRRGSQRGNHSRGSSVGIRKGSPGEPMSPTSAKAHAHDVKFGVVELDDDDEEELPVLGILSTSVFGSDSPGCSTRTEPGSPRSPRFGGASSDGGGGPAAAGDRGARGGSGQGGRSARYRHRRLSWMGDLTPTGKRSTDDAVRSLRLKLGQDVEHADWLHTVAPPQPPADEASFARNQEDSDWSDSDFSSSNNSEEFNGNEAGEGLFDSFSLMSTPSFSMARITIQDADSKPPAVGSSPGSILHRRPGAGARESKAVDEPKPFRRLSAGGAGKRSHSKDTSKTKEEEGAATATLPEEVQEESTEKAATLPAQQENKEDDKQLSTEQESKEKDAKPVVEQAPLASLAEEDEDTFDRQTSTDSKKSRATDKSFDKSLDKPLEKPKHRNTHTERGSVARKSHAERRASRFVRQEPRLTRGSIAMRSGTPKGRLSRFVKVDRDQVVVNSVEVAQMDEGESFGELALQSDNPRSASVRTKGEAYLATLHRDDYRQIMQQTVSRRKQMRLDFLQSLPWFGSLSDSAKERISAMLVEKEVSKGDRICQIDTPARYVFFVMSGTFSIYTMPDTWETPKKGSGKDAAVKVALAEAPAIFGLASYLRNERKHHIDVKCESMQGRVFCVPAKELVMHFPLPLRTQVQLHSVRQEKFYATRATVLSQVQGDNLATRHKWKPKSARTWQEHFSVRRGEHESTWDIYTTCGRRKRIERAVTFNYVNVQERLEDAEEEEEEEQATGEASPKEVPQQASLDINTVTIGHQWSIEPEIARRVLEDHSSSSEEEHLSMVRPWVRKRKKKRGGLKFTSSSPRKHIKGSQFGGAGIWTGQVSRNGRVLPALVDEQLSEQSFGKTRLATAFEQSAFHTVKPARLPHSAEASLVPVPPAGAPSADLTERIRRSPRRAPSQAAKEGFPRSLSGRSSAVNSGSAALQGPPHADSLAESSGAPLRGEPASPLSPLSPSSSVMLAAAGTGDASPGAAVSADSPSVTKQPSRATFVRSARIAAAEPNEAHTLLLQQQQQQQQQQQPQDPQLPDFRCRNTLTRFSRADGHPEAPAAPSEQPQEEEKPEEQKEANEEEAAVAAAEGEEGELPQRPSSASQPSPRRGDLAEMRGSISPCIAGCSDISVERSSLALPAVSSPGWRHRVQRLLLPAVAPGDLNRPPKSGAPASIGEAATTDPLSPGSRVQASIDGTMARTISGGSASGVGARSAELWLQEQANSLMGYEDFASGFFSESVLAATAGASKPSLPPRQPPPPKKALSGSPAHSLGAVFSKSGRVTVEVRHVYRPRPVGYFPAAVHT